jgi:thioredoxin-like negative regulator of GroEL
LISIYKPENKEMNLMFAEMYRELGDFDQALLVLKEIKSIENKVAYNKIKAAAKRKKIKVLKLN